MTSKYAVRLIRLAAVAVVIALFTSLFAATGAQAASLSISGKVTEPDGSAIAGVEVTLYSHDYVSRVKIKKAVVTTSSAGTYTFGSLAAGYYAVGFAAEDELYAAEYWPAYQNLDWAARIDLWSSMANVDATLEVGGKISGSLN